MAPENKVVEVQGFGGDVLDHIKVISKPLPEPKDTEVLVKVHLRPVNPTDILLAESGYGIVNPPFIPGSEGVGTVFKNGPGATKYQEGQRVAAVQWPQFAGKGSWAQYVAIPEQDLVLVPDSLPDTTAAQLWINPFTAYGFFKELNIPQGEYLLQTAATSVLGRQVIALAKHYGVKTINVVRRKDAVQEIKEAGGDEVISTDSADIVERVKAITGGKGAYGAIDPIGGPQARKVVAAVRQGGHYLLYGALDKSPLQTDFNELVSGGKVVRGFMIYGWIEQQDKQQVIKEVLDLLEKKVIVPYSGKSYPLDQVKEAIMESQKIGRGAKLFLEG